MSPRWPIFSTSLFSMTCKALPPHHVGQQCHLPGALYRRGRLPRVRGAQARAPGGPPLAAVGDEPPQQVVILVVDVGDVLLAENARLALRRAPPAGRPVPSPTHSLPPDLSSRDFGGLGEWLLRGAPRGG